MYNYKRSSSLYRFYLLVQLSLFSLVLFNIDPAYAEIKENVDIEYYSQFFKLESTLNSNNNSYSQESITYSKFTFKHFLIILVVFGALLFLSFTLVQLRIKLKNNMVERIPRKIMPFLRPGDLSHKQRTVILNEIVRSKQTQTQIKPQIGDHPIGHLGWGSPGSEYAKVHFKTSISKSWIILERAAIHFDPELKRESKMCIRDYVNLLLDRCPQMNRSLAKLYVETYERARFSEQEFTLDEYTHFMTKFLVLLQDLEKDTSKLISPSSER